MSQYGSGQFYSDPFFYGTDINGAPPGGPVGLNSYQNADGSVVLYWGLHPCSPSLSSLEWTIQTDLTPTFDSSQLRTYTSTGNPNFIVGGVRRGIAVPSYRREQGERTRMHWRVKGAIGSAETAYASSFYDIPEAVDQIVRQEMQDALPSVIYKKDFAAGDFQYQAIVFDSPLVPGNVYDLVVNGTPLTPTAFSVSSDATLEAIAAKIALVPGVGEAKVKAVPGPADNDREILVRSAEKDQSVRLEASIVTGGATQARTEIVLRNTTNVNRLHDAFGRVMDTLNMERILTNGDIFIDTIRDQSLRKNFGSLLDLEQPASMKTIDFREIVRVLMREAGNTPSYAAVRRVLRAMYCADPTFILIRDTLGMYVDDPSSSPPVLPFHVDDPLSMPPIDPEIIWDDQHLGFGVIVQVNNPVGVSIPLDFVRRVVSKLVPVHAPVYVTGI